MTHRLAATLVLPPLSLYIHIPWCVQKCPYCDFNSHASPTAIPEKEYVQALTKDLLAEVPLAQGRKLRSIFFGGGTPSLFSASSIEEILNQAQKIIGFEDDIEITLEANPGTFEQERFKGYRKAGVNRLSIGIQSFNDAHLKTLGRIHDGLSAKNAVISAQDAGFSNMNLDLMHGLPQQTREHALADLETAITLAPQHISWYQLTIEPNTAFYSAPPTLPTEDILADIQDDGHALLTQAGFEHYEISAFTKAHDLRARHNINYWEFSDYLGIGAGAHGKITLPSSHQIIRRWKTRQPAGYIAGQSLHDAANPYTAGQEALSATQLPLDFFMNALRLTEGCPTDFFTARTGLALAQISDKWQDLEKLGLVTPLTAPRLSTTPLGQRFLNDVLQKFSI